ncbi:hypothetical protein BDN70DRAFT_708722 [Pholiota conissans]|uniref:Uncharacterized protein n=1 Tax=Pholiota conissans TaxID=109636 RepID=A0A9P5ZDS2_9AGAR|nr:hypothetical protein BDN70DRAFT_708722 [Pholiota conissans]
MARVLQSGKTPQGRPMRCLPKSLPPFKFSGALSNARPIRLGATDYNFENKMKGRFVGPMPPSLFIEKFLHNADLPEWPNDDSAWARVYNPFVIMKKSAMYEPFIEAVAAYTPGMKFFDTHKHPDNDAYGYAPDISAYDEDDLPDLTRRTDFSKMSLFLEFKISPNEDPFEDPPKKFNKETFHFEKESDESKILEARLGDIQPLSLVLNFVSMFSQC